MDSAKSYHKETQFLMEVKLFIISVEVNTVYQAAFQ
jgi:hypothetical protein